MDYQSAWSAAKRWVCRVPKYDICATRNCNITQRSAVVDPVGKENGVLVNYNTEWMDGLAKIIKKLTTSAIQVANFYLMHHQVY